MHSNQVLHTSLITNTLLIFKLKLGLEFLTNFLNNKDINKLYVFESNLSCLQKFGLFIVLGTNIFLLILRSRNYMQDF